MPLEDLPLPPPDEKPFVLPDQSEMGPLPNSKTERIVAPPTPAPTPVPERPKPPPEPPPLPPPPPPKPIMRSAEMHTVHEPQPMGPIIGVIIIILLLLLGAFYFWGEELNREAKDPSNNAAIQK